jgi:hypothetical protein
MSRRKKQENSELVYIILFIAILGAGVFNDVIKTQFPNTANVPGSEEPRPLPRQTAVYHVHADFKVYVNGEPLSFSSLRYSEKNPKIHLHVRNPHGGDVLHVEDKEAELSDFFDSIGFELRKDCFSTEHEKYCNNMTHSLRYMVNGNMIKDFMTYKPEDLDRILITYGNENNEDLKNQMNSVTNYACISSGKCPIEEDKTDLL